MTDVTRLLTDRTALENTKLATRPVPDLQPGEALLKIRRLALTTNNITYAAFGDTPGLNYWDFFPTGETGWGQIPAWGFADVVHSTVDGLATGERFYGFWPLATHLVMEPVRVSERGFYDGKAHRLELTSAYNQYQRTRTDAAYRANQENYQMLYRPLFITSFMLADYLEDNGFFGARQVLISSASSKTAYGTTFCLEDNGGVAVVGLTSSDNQAFVDGLGSYSKSIDYTDIEQLDPDVATLYVDFSGNDDVRARIHRHFGSSLMHDCYAGSAHSHEHIGSRDESLPGPKPVLYFAPNQIRKRNNDWGPAEVTRRFNAAQQAFIDRVSNPARPWIEVREHDGMAGAREVVQKLVEGQVRPLDGHVVILG